MYDMLLGMKKKTFISCLDHVISPNFYFNNKNICFLFCLTFLKFIFRSREGELWNSFKCKQVFAMDMESGTSTSAATTTTTTSATTKEKYYPLIRDGSWFTQFRYGCNPWMARYVYGLIFLITNFLAWVVRDYGNGAMKDMASKNRLQFY